MSAPRRTAVLAAGVCVLLAGCTGDGTNDRSPAQGGAAGSASASATPKACRTEGPSQPWPAPVAADLPVPPRTTITSAEPQGGLTVVRFTSATGLRENVLFAVRELPAAGWRLGRGDAEAAEADAPFFRGPARGLLRFVAKGDCRVEGLLAWAPGGTVPLPTYTPKASPTPLPFG